MEHICSPDLNLTAADRQLLLEVARQAVAYAAREGNVMPINLNDFPAEFAKWRATFVTIKRHGRLRGCTGMIEAIRPLVVDAVSNAYSSAMRDPRFNPLTPPELEGLTLSVSILSPPSAIDYDDEEDLLRKIRPGVDGVILEKGMNRGLFLPVMWKQIPDAYEFMAHLKMKAGWRPNYWASGIKAFRFTADLVAENPADD